AAAVRELGLPLTLNVVIHRGNIARVGAFIALAERIGAERLELANTQYLGWALANRDALLPARADIERARAIAAAAADRLRGKIEILFVRPDYYADRPRACMDGWARRYTDFGGCRCQAFALLGDAGATDPACALSPRHELVREARARAEQPAAAPPPIRLRRMRTSA